MANRKSAQDLRKDYQELLDKTIAFEIRIRNRLKELIKNYPDVPVARKADADRTIIKANSLNNDYYLNGMSIHITLQYIEIIETYLAKQHPHQQGKLFK